MNQRIQLLRHLELFKAQNCSACKQHKEQIQSCVDENCDKIYTALGRLIEKLGARYTEKSTLLRRISAWSLYTRDFIYTTYLPREVVSDNEIIALLCKKFNITNEHRKLLVKYTDLPIYDILKDEKPELTVLRKGLHKQYDMLYIKKKKRVEKKQKPSKAILKLLQKIRS